MNSRERSVTPIVGIVLLFGLVAITSLSILVVGGALISDTEQQLEQERIEQSFIELSQSVATESDKGDMRSNLELEAGEQGAITRENTATIEVNADNLDDPISFDVGAVEWEGDDGTTVAYQGGGVFRETGEETQLLSTPSINYDLESETLTMPVYNVSGEESLQSGTVSIEQEGISAEHEVAYIQEDNVTIRIESEYYLGWKEYFENQAGESIVTDYGTDGGEGDMGYVEAKLGYIDFGDEVFSDGISYSEGCDTGFGAMDCEDFNPVSEGDRTQPMDSVVNQMINNPEEANNQSFDYIVGEGQDIGDVSGSDTYEDDFTLIDRDFDGDTIEVDLEDGNATLAVDGDIRNTDITVTETDDDHTLQIYLNGSYHSDGPDVCVEDCVGDGTTIQIFGTSQTALNFDKSVTFEGLLYAASDDDEWDHPDCNGCSDHQFYAQQAPDIFGGVVVNNMHIDSAGGGLPAHGLPIERDPAIDDIDVEFREDLLPPQLTYMNVVEHRMTVGNE